MKKFGALQKKQGLLRRFREKLFRLPREDTFSTSRILVPKKNLRPNLRRETSISR